jgi:hypothetical protein
VNHRLNQPNMKVEVCILPIGLSSLCCCYYVVIINMLLCCCYYDVVDIVIML